MGVSLTGSAGPDGELATLGYCPIRPSMHSRSRSRQQLLQTPPDARFARTRPTVQHDDTDSHARHYPPCRSTMGSRSDPVRDPTSVRCSWMARSARMAVSSSGSRLNVGPASYTDAFCRSNSGLRRAFSDACAFDPANTLTGAHPIGSLDELRASTTTHTVLQTPRPR